MKITEIQILPIKPKDGLVAFASVVLEESIYLGSIGIHQKLGTYDYRLTYPTKVVAGHNINIYHPLNKELSKAIEKAVFKKFKEVTTKCNDRHSRFKHSA